MSSVIVPPDSDSNTKPTESTATANADEEPQNALTQKFTEKEWAALKEFRVRVCHHNLRSRVSFFFCFLNASLAPSPRYTRKGL
jgi:hypothetical protein